MQVCDLCRELQLVLVVLPGGGRRGVARVVSEGLPLLPPEGGQPMKYITKEEAQELKRARMRARRNKPNNKASLKRYRNANKKKINELHQEYYATHADDQRAYHRAYYEKHREALLVYNREWRKKKEAPQ